MNLILIIKKNEIMKLNIFHTTKNVKRIYTHLFALFKKSRKLRTLCN